MKRKFKRISKIFACCLSLLLLNFGAPCWAQDPDIQDRKESRGTRHKEGGKNDILKELDLSNEQQKELSAYHKQGQDENKEVFSGLKKARAELMQELENPDSNAKEIERLSNEIKKFQGKMLDFHIRSIANIKKVLTPEQYKNFQEKAKEKRKQNNKRKLHFEEKEQ